MKKGTHRAINRFRSFNFKVSKNNTKTCFVLKCDVQKFFASIDHKILESILSGYIPDRKIIWLLGGVIDSFETGRGIGIPLGNLTSQLFANLYMNKFDQFIKHKLKTRYYIRYADDFVLLSRNKNWLKRQVPLIDRYLKDSLKLKLHRDKIMIKTVASGVDFLGWTNFIDHRVLRTATKNRMLKRLLVNQSPETINSYLGLLGHGNNYKIKRMILRKIFYVF